MTLFYITNSTGLYMHASQTAKRKNDINGEEILIILLL